MTWITVRKVLYYRELLEEFLPLPMLSFGLPLFFWNFYLSYPAFGSSVCKQQAQLWW